MTELFAPSSHRIQRARTRSVWTVAAALLLLPLAIFDSTSASAQTAAPTLTAQFGVGASEIAPLSPGRRYLFVATTGSDTFDRVYSSSTVTVNRYSCLPSATAGDPKCPEATTSLPLRSIGAAIRAARPGDVVIVRGGVYREAAGWGAVRATSNARITVQNYPGERVELNGTLQLRNADYWTIRGLRLTYNPSIQNGQSIVTLSGGVGWAFLNNEVVGSVGVANVLVVAEPPESTSTVDRVNAAPREYVIAGNCVRDNRGNNAHGMDHNIYLMSTIYSTGGIVERNLLSGAPNGSNIKLAGSSTSAPNSSPRNVTIRYNTLVNAATGIVLGLKAERIEISRNIIANQVRRQKWDGGVKGWRIANPGRIGVKDNLITGYSPAFFDTSGVFTVRNNTRAPFTYTRSVAGCTAIPDNTGYGHYG